MSGPFSCTNPARTCPCRQQTRFGGQVCRRVGNRPRTVDCEAAPSQVWCSTCPLWDGLYSCASGTDPQRDKETQAARLGRIPLKGTT